MLSDPVLALICVCAGLISNCQPLRFWGLLRDMTVGYKLKYIREGMGIGDMRLKDVVGGGDGWTPLAHCANLLDVTPFYGPPLFLVFPITLPVFPNIFYKHIWIFISWYDSGEPRYIFVLVLFGLKLCHGKINKIVSWKTFKCQGTLTTILSWPMSLVCLSRKIRLVWHDLFILFLSELLKLLFLFLNSPSLFIDIPWRYCRFGLDLYNKVTIAIEPVTWIVCFPSAVMLVL